MFNAGDFKYPMTHWLTSTVYAIVDAQIRVCDENITSCVNFVQEEHLKLHRLLTISVEKR